MSLETLLRDSNLRYGRIALDRTPDGLWHAAICHFNDHMTKDCAGHDDPVDALRVALIEDARITADKVRRYRDAPKATGGWKQKDGFPTFAASADDDFEALL